MGFQLTWEDRMVIFDYSGDMTSQDILNSNRSVYGDPRFDRLHWQLVCVDQVESFNFEEKDVKLIAYMDKAAALANSNITIVFAGENDNLKKLYTAYSEFIEGDLWPVHYFETREEALSYIGDLEAESIA